MRLIRIAIASVNTKVGAIDAQARRIVAFARRMAEEDVTVGCFPEQVIGGYPAEDLVQWDAFVMAQRRALDSIARGTRDVPAALVLGLTVGCDGHLYNTAAVLHRGEILGFVPKEKLPTYSVFYEARTLSRGARAFSLDASGIPLGDRIFSFDFGILAVEVCEDAWTPDGPMRRRCFSGAEVVVNISASPFRVGIDATRREMFATRSSDNRAVLVYTNQVGSQDGLIFDGGGLIYESGRLILDAPRFREGVWTGVVDLDRTRRLRREDTTWRSDCTAFLRDSTGVPVIAAAASTGDRSTLPYPPPPTGGNYFIPGDDTVPLSARDALLDELLDALALGVGDYFRKAGRFTGIGIALSGGRDSLLTLLVAWLAARRADAEPDREPIPIHAFYMSSRFSLEPTRGAARAICDELGIPLVELPIEDAIDREADATRSMLGGDEPGGMTLQNIQARLRATRMWNWSNSAGALFLQTGDMSEKAVGYTTIGGDLEGALSPIANVPKTVVIALLERLHDRFGFKGIRMTLDTEPGPELATAQTAEEELMPFEILDACLHLYAGEKLSARELAAVLPGLFPDLPVHELREHARRFVTMFTRSIYKWVQSPLSLHVGALDLERERALQIPVVHDSDWDDDEQDR